MVDILALALSHGLIALAVWRLLARDDLDRDPAEGTGAAPEPVRPQRPARRKRAMIVPGSAPMDGARGEPGA
ncbi:hypothetical protein HT136_10265 [Novosphingobium profundi]|uniref:hypothetical protein n=1 Tax=Novosphingobium profundi TaxID=1774954 RepID=UPI001BD978C1|nr:hypothetical protein [Novosphingobium profundi]MBT0668749.1 hypothetical protein [Novosphingobium profundi]